MKTEIEKITILPGINKFGEKEKSERIDIEKGEIVAIVGPTGTGNPEDDKPKICPCQWHREEVEKDGHCFCGLFYK